MSQPGVLNSQAPYERICTACKHVRLAVDFSRGHRICSACRNQRMNSVPSSGGTGGMPAQTTYDGAELQPFAGRPGAMDAFALPSLRFGERVYRRGFKPEVLP